PPALRTADFVESTIQSQHHPVRALDRVEAVVPQAREAGEIVLERDRQISVEVMVSKRWIDGDFLAAPDSRFPVVYFPIFGFVAVVGDVAAKSDKVRVGIGDGPHQLPADFGVSGSSVGRVGESSVTVCDEAEW